MKVGANNSFLQKCYVNYTYVYFLNWYIITLFNHLITSEFATIQQHDSAAFIIVHPGKKAKLHEV